jgi:hypothetical protein
VLEILEITQKLLLTVKNNKTSVVSRCLKKNAEAEMLKMKANEVKNMHMYFTSYKPKYYYSIPNGKKDYKHSKE